MWPKAPTISHIARLSSVTQGFRYTKALLDRQAVPEVRGDPQEPGKVQTFLGNLQGVDSPDPQISSLLHVHIRSLEQTSVGRSRKRRGRRQEGHPQRAPWGGPVGAVQGEGELGTQASTQNLSLCSHSIVR